MSFSLNRCEIVGNLGADPEMRYTAGGTATTELRVAVTRSWQKDGEWQEETEWFHVVCWAQLAERTAERLRKGMRIFCEGRIATRSWDGTDGVKHYRTELIANRVAALDKAEPAA